MKTKTLSSIFLSVLFSGLISFVHGIIIDPARTNLIHELNTIYTTDTDKALNEINGINNIADDPSITKEKNDLILDVKKLKNDLFNEIKGIEGNSIGDENQVKTDLQTFKNRLITINNGIDDLIKENTSVSNEYLKIKARIEQKEKDAAEKLAGTELQYITDNPPVYINMSSNFVNNTSLNVKLIGSSEPKKSILSNQIETYRFAGYADSNGFLVNGELTFLVNNKEAKVIASSSIKLQKHEEIPVSVTIDNMIYQAKVKVELKPITLTTSSITPTTPLEAYFIEIVPGSIQAERIKSQQELFRERVSGHH